MCVGGICPGPGASPLWLAVLLNLENAESGKRGRARQLHVVSDNYKLAKLFTHTANTVEKTEGDRRLQLLAKSNYN